MQEIKAYKFLLFFSSQSLATFPCLNMPLPEILSFRSFQISRAQPMPKPIDQLICDRLTKPKFGLVFTHWLMVGDASSNVIDVKNDVKDPPRSGLTIA